MDIKFTSRGTHQQLWAYTQLWNPQQVIIQTKLSFSISSSSHSISLFLSFFSFITYLSLSLSLSLSLFLSLLPSILPRGRLTLRALRWRWQSSSAGTGWSAPVCWPRPSSSPTTRACPPRSSPAETEGRGRQTRPQRKTTHTAAAEFLELVRFG